MLVYIVWNEALTLVEKSMKQRLNREIQHLKCDCRLMCQVVWLFHLVFHQQFFLFAGFLGAIENTTYFHTQPVFVVRTIVQIPSVLMLMVAFYFCT